MASDDITRKILNIILTHVNPRQGLANLKNNLSPGIVKIIQNATIPVETKIKVVNYTPVNDVANSILKLIENGVKPPPSVAAVVAEKLTTEGNQTNANVQKILKVLADVIGAPQVVNTNAPPEGSIGRAYYAGKKVGWVFGTPTEPLFHRRGQENLMNSWKGWRLRRRNANGNTYNFYYTRPARTPPPSSTPWSWPKLFGRKSKMPNVGPQGAPNFVEAPFNVGQNGKLVYRPPPENSGYILTTRNGKTGWYKNKKPVPTYVAPLAAQPPAAQPPAAQPPAPRNYTKMKLRELLDARKKYPENKDAITKAIQKLFEEELRSARYNGRSRRARRIGDLLRILPRNFNGRRNATSLVINDIRNTRNSTDLSNLKSNLGSVPNENIRRAFEEQRRRFNRRKPHESENEYRRRIRGYESEYRRRQFTPRRPYESDANYNRRRTNFEAEEMRRRREARARAEAGRPVSNEKPFNRGAPQEPPPPPPLPQNQQRAINNAGGAPRALATVASVPGGAPEVAKAAEALNETAGNVQQAIYIKGASPAAIAAVKNLGGPNNAVVVLEGLNTMAQTNATRKRKAARMIARPKKRGPGRRTKPVKPRVAELNRVINAVKKQKLVSLVAHNVTKTHNIHPNDEKLKKYYKKVLKSNILRTPFAKIVKKAAKK